MWGGEKEKRGANGAGGVMCIEDRGVGRSSVQLLSMSRVFVGLIDYLFF